MSQQFQSGPGQSQRIPSEQLVFNLCWNPGAVHPSASERRPSNTTDGLAGDSESKQTKSKSHLLPCPFVWPGQDLRWDFTTHVIQSRKSLPGLGFSWLHTQSKEMDAPRSSGVPQSQCRQRSGCTLPSTVPSAAFSGSRIPWSFGSLLAVCLLKSI